MTQGRRLQIGGEAGASPDRHIWRGASPRPGARFLDGQDVLLLCRDHGARRSRPRDDASSDEAELRPRCHGVALMRLAELVDNAIHGAAGLPADIADLEIAGLAVDSRRVKAGRPLLRGSGNPCRRARLCGGGREGRRCRDGRRAHDPLRRSVRPSSWCKMSGLRWRLRRSFFPQAPRTIVAVTGTAGKTSVADFARQIFRGAGGARRRASARSGSSSPAVSPMAP